MSLLKMRDILSTQWRQCASGCESPFSLASSNWWPMKRSHRLQYTSLTMTVYELYGYTGTAHNASSETALRNEGHTQGPLYLSLLEYKHVPHFEHAYTPCCQWSRNRSPHVTISDKSSISSSACFVMGLHEISWYVEKSVSSTCCMSSSYLAYFFRFGR